MKTFLLTYAITGLLLLGIDGTWLWSMSGFYREKLGDLMVDRFNVAPALMFYLIYAAGVATFAVLPSLRSASWTDALFYGALLGLVSYATYDLTNLATIKNWSVPLTAIDLCWGTVLSAVVATAAHFAVRRVLGGTE